jgi:hypothetical protein
VGAVDCDAYESLLPRLLESRLEEAWLDSFLLGFEPDDDMSRGI